MNFVTGDMFRFVESFDGFLAKGQEVEFVAHHGSTCGAFIFVNKDGGAHSLNGLLEGERSRYGLYIPYSCVEPLSIQLEND